MTFWPFKKQRQPVPVVVAMCPRGHMGAPNEVCDTCFKNWIEANVPKCRVVGEWMQSS